jgi:ABC-type nitrate/sulfonate/bicarbonate transport system ATPase subunit
VRPFFCIIAPHNAQSPPQRTRTRWLPPGHPRPRPQALLGPSGAGKSTLLEVLSLRRRPAAGRVSAPRSRRAVAFVPQDGAFPPTLSVLEVVRFHEALLPPHAAVRNAALNGAAGAAAGVAAAGRPRAEAVLRVMGLGAAADTLVRGGGCAGRLCLATTSGP